MGNEVQRSEIKGLATRQFAPVYACHCHFESFFIVAFMALL